MKTLKFTLGAMAAVAAAAFTVQAEEAAKEVKPEAAEQAEAEENEDEGSPLFEVSLSAEINSGYVSHNRIFSDTPVAQYDVWLQMNLPENFGWIAADIWANQELNKRHARNWSHGGNGGKGDPDIGDVIKTGETIAFVAIGAVMAATILLIVLAASKKKKKKNKS